MVPVELSPARLFLVVLLLSICAGGAKAEPSFDCRAATTPFEKIICATTELADLDRDLGNAYLGIKKRFAAESDKIADLVTTERLWLKYLPEECGVPRQGEVIAASGEQAISCLTQRYKDRLANLRELASAPRASEDFFFDGTIRGNIGRIIPVTSPEKMASIRKDLGSSLDASRPGSNISGCDQILSVMPLQGRDESFVAICTVSSPQATRRMLMCDDTMVGKFTAVDAAPTADKRSLEAFLRMHCPPGG